MLGVKHGNDGNPLLKHADHIKINQTYISANLKITDSKYINIYMKYI